MTLGRRGGGLRSLQRGTVTFNHTDTSGSEAITTVNRDFADLFGGTRASSPDSGFRVSLNASSVGWVRKGSSADANGFWPYQVIEKWG